MGNDYIYGQGLPFSSLPDGADNLYGNEGNDFLKGAGGNDKIRGGEGNDILIGGKGKDLLSGGDIGLAKATDGFETAKFEGSNAVTISVGGSALDSTYAGEADFASAYFVQSSVAGDLDTLISIEKLLGSSANDTLKLNSLSAAILANSSSKQGGLAEVNLAAGTAVSGRGGDMLDMSGMSESVNLTANNLSFVIAAKAAASRKVTVLDAEHIIGTGFNDTLNFGATVTRGLIIEGGAGADNITGGSGSDLITGGAGNDALNGGAGDDEMNGGAGNDKIYAGDGDVLTGGEGNDIFYLDSKLVVSGSETREARVTITDLEAGDRIYVDGKLIRGSTVSTTADDYYGDFYSSISETYSWLEGSSFSQKGKTGEEYYHFTEGSNGTIVLREGTFGEKGVLITQTKGITIEIDLVGSAAGSISYHYAIAMMSDPPDYFYGTGDFNLF